MKIRKIRHRGLRRFIENDDSRELRGDQLAGDRAGTWSISVSGNWRITFTIERGEITNLDL
jgi:proteic killer suppression protein